MPARIKEAVEQAIKLLDGMGHNPVEIQRVLESAVRPGTEAKQYYPQVFNLMRGQKSPHLRTIRRYYQPRLIPPSSRWRLADADPEYANLVLDALAMVMQDSQGQTQSVTVDHANWIIRVRRACPSMIGWAAWWIARTYMVREARGEDAADLDAQLGFWPQPGMSDKENLRRVLQRAKLHGQCWNDRPFSSIGINHLKEYKAHREASYLATGEQGYIEPSLALVSEGMGSSSYMKRWQEAEAEKEES